MKIPPQSTLSGFFDKKIQEFGEWIVEVFEPFFEFWPTVWHATRATRSYEGPDYRLRRG